MATFKAASVLKQAITLSQAGQIVAAVGEYSLPATHAVNDIVALCHLPAEHEPVDFMLQADDLDDATAMVVSVGVLNAGMTDLVSTTNFITTSTVGQAGGVARAAIIAGLQLASSSADRVVGMKITTAAGTPAAGKVRGVLLYKRK